MLVSVNINRKQVKFLDNLAKAKATSRYKLLKDLNAWFIRELQNKYPNILSETASEPEPEEETPSQKPNILS